MFRVEVKPSRIQQKQVAVCSTEMSVSELYSVTTQNNKYIILLHISLNTRGLFDSVLHSYTDSERM